MKPRVFSTAPVQAKFTKLETFGNIQKGDNVKVLGHGTFVFSSYVEHNGQAWVDVIDPDTKACRSFSIDKIKEVKHGRRHSTSNVTRRKGQ